MKSFKILKTLKYYTYKNYKKNIIKDNSKRSLVIK
jgi:hypothetical protein